MAKSLPRERKEKKKTRGGEKGKRKKGVRSESTASTPRGRRFKERKQSEGTLEETIKPVEERSKPYTKDAQEKMGTPALKKRKKKTSVDFLPSEKKIAKKKASLKRGGKVRGGKKDRRRGKILRSHGS